MTRRPAIGFEVHAQLATRTKIFCACGNAIGGEPNTRVCPVCLGLPGALPALNARALELGAIGALALGAKLAPRSSFARKSYFYPDLPKGYQITQDERPLATGGGLDVERDGRIFRVGIRQLHIEEDAGKTTHRPGGDSLVDMNRCGVPLLEIVTLPEIEDVEDAVAFAEEIRRVLVFCGVTSGRMHEGSLRFDTNVSLRAEDGVPGTPCEIKNLNSFRSIRHALEREVVRQSAVLDSEGRVEHQTLLWDERSGEARPMRSKEEASDYRYFREPDLPDVELAPERIAEIQALVPELPREVRERLTGEFGLPADLAAVVADDPWSLSYFERAVAATSDSAGAPSRSSAVAFACARWFVGPLRGLAHERSVPLDESFDRALSPARFAELVSMRLSGRLTEPAARRLLAAALDEDDELDALAERLGLEQITDEAELASVVRSVLAEHPEELARLRRGEHKLVRFLVGQVMARTRGNANPARVKKLIESAGKETPG